MLSPSNLFYCLTSAIFLTCSVTQALRPPRAPNQIISKIDETPHNGSAVPGLSPVKYHNDPGNDLFRIKSLDMHPNPCVMYVFYSNLLSTYQIIPFISKTLHFIAHFHHQIERRNRAQKMRKEPRRWKSKRMRKITSSFTHIPLLTQKQ